MSKTEKKTAQQIEFKVQILKTKTILLGCFFYRLRHFPVNFDQNVELSNNLPL
jgi:hypothetical protein